MFLSTKCKANKVKWGFVVLNKPSGLFFWLGKAAILGQNLRIRRALTDK